MRIALIIAAFGLPWLPGVRGPASSGVTPAWVYNVSFATATSNIQNDPAYTWGAVVTANQTGSCTKVAGGFASSGSGYNIKAGLFDMSLVPLGSGTAGTTSGTSVDMEVTLASPVSVTSGTSYIVLYAVDSASAGYSAYINPITNQGRIDFSNGYSTFPLNPATTGINDYQFRVGMYIQ